MTKEYKTKKVTFKISKKYLVVNNNNFMMFDVINFKHYVKLVIQKMVENGDLLIEMKNAMRKKLLNILLKEFDDKNIHEGEGSYKPGRRLCVRARTIDRINQTVDRYIEFGHNENIIEYYKKLHLAPLKDRSNQRQKDIHFKNRKIQEKNNLKFIEENNLVEHKKYPGYYGTIDGKIYSSKGRYGKIRLLKPIVMKSNNDYCLINPGNDSQGKKIQVMYHRFIAEIFLPNPNNLPEINHKDENKKNNAASNLEWCDRQYNVEYSISKFFKITNLKTNETIVIKNFQKWCREQNLKVSPRTIPDKGMVIDKTFRVEKL